MSSFGIGRKIWHVTAGLVFVVVALYAVALGAQAASAWGASRMLDRVERLRLGMPMENFERAVSPCNVEKSNNEIGCTETAGALRFGLLWWVVRKVTPRQWDDESESVLARLGLRSWQLRLVGVGEGGSLVKVSANLLGSQRYESLLAQWQLAESVPEWLLRRRGATQDDRRLTLYWVHVSSQVSGEGLKVFATPRATERELQARLINHGCLFSFRGCDGLRELMPEAIRLLGERGSDVGCTNVSASCCEPRYSHCRENLRRIVNWPR